MPTSAQASSPDSRILKFIQRHHVMTLCTAESAVEDGMWCCNLFYAVTECTSSGPALVFTSPLATEHATNFTTYPEVAGSIVLESKVIGKLQGLQLQGIVRRADAFPELQAQAKKAYLKRFPFAAVMLSDLWVVELTRLKYTDNTLGFGTKLHWPAQ